MFAYLKNSASDDNEAIFKFDLYVSCRNIGISEFLNVAFAMVVVIIIYRFLTVVDCNGYGNSTRIDNTKCFRYISISITKE